LETPGEKMTPITSGQAKVQLIDPNDRERAELQLLLESMGLGVEVFASVAERAKRAPRSGHCLLCTVDGVAPPWHELDDLLGEIGEGTPVVLVCRAPPLSLVVRALKAGAVDVLCKPVDAQELRRAVEEALERSDSERLHRSRIDELRQRLDRLTTREQEVCDRLITGQLNKQVGAHLGITERTVKAHRASILRKVAVGSLAELVRLATTLELARQQLELARQQLERAGTASKQRPAVSDEVIALTA
jgi:FixJ family two-component response regulator